MSLPNVFAESFIDGFTMAGFVNRLRPPGNATQMFAQACGASSNTSGDEWKSLTFLPGDTGDMPVSMAGSLRRVPEQALHAMMDLLRKEDEERMAARQQRERAAHGVSR